MQVVCGACSARYTIADEKVPIQGARVRCRKCQAVFSIERGAALTPPPTPPALPLIPPTPQEAPPAAAPPAPPSAPFTLEPLAPPAPFAPSASPNPFAAPAPPDPSPAAAAPSGPPAFDGYDQVAPTEIERFTPAFASGTAAVAAQPEAAALEHVPAHAPPAPPAATWPAQAEPPAPPAAEHRQERAPGSPAASAGGSSSSGVPEGLPEAERLKHERARRLARVLASDIAIYNKEKRDRGIKDGNLVAVLGYEIKKSWEVYKERVTPELANSTPYFRDALNEMLAEGKKVF